MPKYTFLLNKGRPNYVSVDNTNINKNIMKQYVSQTHVGSEIKDRVNASIRNPLPHYNNSVRGKFKYKYEAARDWVERMIAIASYSPEPMSAMAANGIGMAMDFSQSLFVEPDQESLITGYNGISGGTGLARMIGSSNRLRSFGKYGKWADNVLDVTGHIGNVTDIIGIENVNDYIIQRGKFVNKNNLPKDFMKRK